MRLTKVWILCVAASGDGNEYGARPLIHEFYTYAAADLAATFFRRQHCTVTVIEETRS